MARNARGDVAAAWMVRNRRGMRRTEFDYTRDSSGVACPPHVGRDSPRREVVGMMFAAERACRQASTTLTSVVDSRGNVYTIDYPTVSNGGGPRVAIASARLSAGLQIGDTITANFGARAAVTRVMVAAAFTNVRSQTPWLDVSTSRIGTAPLVTIGPSAQTQTARELAIAAVGFQKDAFGIGCPACATAASAGPNVYVRWENGFQSAGSVRDANTNQIGIDLGYKVLSASASVTASATLEDISTCSPDCTPISGSWAGILATYKAAP